MQATCVLEKSYNGSYFLRICALGLYPVFITILVGFLLPRLHMNFEGLSLKKKLLTAVVTILVVVLVWRLSSGTGGPQRYRTTEIQRGDLLVAVSATGIVEPEEVIDVGAQVAGQILSFGKDSAGNSIDYGSQVEEGTILAQIDDSLYTADVVSAEAQVKRANADLAQLQAKLLQAEQDWKRAQKLGASNAISQSSFDSFKAAYDVALATVNVGHAAVTQAEAQLSKARRNLGYCTIKSPVKGVIIDRRVNIGQTVVSSLNAPSLFLLAKDLRRIQVWAAVNEADIGRIQPGQAVQFTVDTYPGESFSGTVNKIRLNASMNQSVVTYTVEVNTDNSNSRLLPYLTANVQFEVENLKEVLLVPSMALRWKPRVDTLQRDAKIDQKNDKRNTIWTLVNGRPIANEVKILGTDSLLTAVQADSIQEGGLVIVGEVETQGAEKAPGTNPFAPQMPRSRRPS